MRDEDLKNLPQQIEGWKIKELLTAIGITEHTHVREMHVYPTEVQVTVLATDADGRKLWREVPRDIEVTDLNDAEPSYVAGRPDREPMVHEISIPVSQVWTKPSAEPDPDLQASMPDLWRQRCQSVLQDADGKLQCERPAEHGSALYLGEPTVHAARRNDVLHKW